VTDSQPTTAWRPAGITAITLFVEDLDATKRFYVEVFGLLVVFEDGDSAVFNFGNTLVNLLAATAAHGLIGPAAVGGRDAGARLQLTIEVDDVDGPWGVRTACFMDPAGHIWEIAH
jgi:catechol 2,3-dioxygenase-like lactoylglutathione lyase family enzyme